MGLHCLSRWQRRRQRQQARPLAALAAAAAMGALQQDAAADVCGASSHALSSSGVNGAPSPNEKAGLRGREVAAAARLGAAAAAAAACTLHMAAAAAAVVPAAAGAAADDDDADETHTKSPPYRSFVRHTTQFLKIDGMEPEDLPPDWRERLAEALARHGRVLSGACMRRGCVELVFQYVELNPAGGVGLGAHRRRRRQFADGAAGAGGGTDAHAVVAAPLSLLELGHVHGLMKALPLQAQAQLLPAHAGDGAGAATEDRSTAAAVGLLGAAEVLGAGTAAPQGPVRLAASAAFHGSVAAAAGGACGGGPHAAALAPRFLSLTPRVVLLPPPAVVQPGLSGPAAAQRRPAAARLVPVLGLELWFPPRLGASASAEGGGCGGGSGAAAAVASGAGVEVLLRQRRRYLPVSVRRLPLRGGPRARAGRAGAAVASASASASALAAALESQSVEFGEGFVERYEVDVVMRLGGGGGESAAAAAADGPDGAPAVLLEPGLLHVDVRWGGVPCMSLPVLLLPPSAAAGSLADAGGRGAASGVAAAAHLAPAEVDMAAVAEELQQFSRWCDRRGGVAATVEAAAAAAARASAIAEVGEGEDAGMGHAMAVGYDNNDDDDDDEDAAGALLRDLGLVLYSSTDQPHAPPAHRDPNRPQASCSSGHGSRSSGGDAAAAAMMARGAAAGGADDGAPPIRCGRSSDTPAAAVGRAPGATSASTPASACIAPADQHCLGRLLLGREALRYAAGNGMPHLAGLVGLRLAVLESELAALGGGSGASGGGGGGRKAVPGSNSGGSSNKAFCSA
ncbi:hypothetical protein HYH02_003231 [Chlamydomonas schloesseri]|uniref:HTH myb-type domain-containing protein n=1 Tax=Chlamydomonas schloesseri TaxID=2026947 RepID=A0A835WR62_9CHLO|nr:hypothetical protein HYH02_003231 [Chlamydomonas schloesseri]|eukprot:KAG2452200.1 hypothetical protein HYH02_003231 [Chlamydomonas schloesseri]